MTENGSPALEPNPALTGVSLAISFDAEHLYQLRSAVAAHATQLGMDEARLGNLLVVATELATNVIRHGGGEGSLRLWRTGDRLLCQVSDNGPGFADAHQAGTSPVPLDSNGSRGLWLVRQFTDELLISNRNPGVTVTAAIKLTI